MPKSDIKIVVTGANGRMGRMLIQAVSEHPKCRLIGALGRKGAKYLGMDAGELAGISPLNLAVTAEPHQPIAQCDAVIDFTPPPSLRTYAELAAQAGAVYICGSTGLTQEDETALEKASHHIAVVYSANMSLGVNLLQSLVRQAAAKLPPEYDIEIAEMHHRHKRDAPSGTALLLGKAAAQARAIDHDTNIETARHGNGDPRKQNTIGYAVMRGGSVVGEHHVIFAGEKERLTLSHRAESRDVFAHGAITAALWGQDKAAGLYSMADVLGL